MRLQTKSIFKDKDGRIVIWQYPNWLLWSWILLKVCVELLTKSRLQSGFEHLDTSILFVWALYETTKGVNYFRKGLGIAILIIISLGYFR